VSDRLYPTLKHRYCVHHNVSQPFR